MLKKASGDLVRRQNRGLVLETLRQYGPMARISLGHRTGLSPASITSISNQLIEEGLVHYSGDDDIQPARAKRGRPQTMLALNPDATNVLAISISVDGVELVFADFIGRIRATARLPINTYGIAPDDFGPRIAREVTTHAALNHLTLASIKRIGISIQGVADTNKGEIAWSPAFKARNIPVVEPLERLLGITCSIANNANRIADALLAKDPAKYSGTTAVVFMGHGIGLGLILNGQVFSGTSGRAAEFGHTNHVPGGALCRCGSEGCLEAYSADYGILRMAKAAKGESFDIHAAVAESDLARIESAAEAGEAYAVEAYRKAGEVLGYGIGRLIALINPARVVLAGSGTRAYRFMDESLHQALERGLVHELRKDVSFEVLCSEEDMIVTGTLMETLQCLDREVFATRQPVPAPEPKTRKFA